MIDYRAGKIRILAWEDIRQEVWSILWCQKVRKNKQKTQESDRKKTNTAWYHTCGIQGKKVELIETESGLVVVMRMEENGNGEVGKRVQTFSYKMDKF